MDGEEFPEISQAYNSTRILTYLCIALFVFSLGMIIVLFIKLWKWKNIHSDFQIQSDGDNEDGDEQPMINRHDSESQAISSASGGITDSGQSRELPDGLTDSSLSQSSETAVKTMYSRQGESGNSTETSFIQSSPARKRPSSATGKGFKTGRDLDFNINTSSSVRQQSSVAPGTSHKTQSSCDLSPTRESPSNTTQQGFGSVKGYKSDKAIADSTEPRRSFTSVTDKSHLSESATGTVRHDNSCPEQIFLSQARQSGRVPEENSEISGPSYGIPPGNIIDPNSICTSPQQPSSAEYHNFTNREVPDRTDAESSRQTHSLELNKFSEPQFRQ